MSLQSYNPNSRYKERNAQRIASLLGTLAVIIISALVGFWLGKQYGAEQLIVFKQKVETMEVERVALQDQVTELSASAQTANTRFSQLQDEVQEVLPEGPVQDIVSLVREQVKQGMDPERLAFVIRSARPPSGCTDAKGKRFVVKTPAYEGPESFASVADGLIKVGGNGQSARNDKGLAEAWYDPTKAVEISFIHNGIRESKQGVLPLRYSVIANNREYRFTIEKGARSFAKATYDSCAYP
jgi:cell division protein FtsB